MVVGLALAAVQMGMALPTGFLFGVGYGTGVRVGYEQVYPLLFPKGARPTTTELAATMKGMNTVYDAIGGKDASRMGIAVGIINAGEILNNPDFRVLEQLESSSSGPTSSNSNRLVSGRGSLDLSDNSSDEIVAEEIAEFNKLTNSEMWTKIRAMTTGQILNSRTGSGMSKEWMDITGKVLLERTLSDFQGPTIDSPLPPVVQKPFTGIKDVNQPVAIAWIKQRDRDINAYHQSRKAIEAGASGKDKSAHITRGNNIRRRLVTQSNDYRHPNNFIRSQAIILRQLLVSSIYRLT